MNRKKFIISGGLFAISMTAFGKVISGADKTFIGSCKTTNDILGPFYRPDAPLRSDLTTPSSPGKLICVKGKVMGPDCSSPLDGALIEIWHCDTLGNYDNSSPRFDNRAKWMTEADGNYTFKTIMPGKYLNGELYRPSHIHFRITCQGYKEIISQIYFKGDPDISHDPWASDPMAKQRVLDVLPMGVQSTGNGENLEVTFNVYMEFL